MLDEVVLNEQAPWSEFDSDAYVAGNYHELQAADAEIISIMRDHFGGYFAEHPDPVIGVDVGAGANLYPALAMLPWCKEITLFEHAPRNLAYLTRQLEPESYDKNWDQFWEALRENREYAEFKGDPRERFREVVRVAPANILASDLGEQLREKREAWSVGTMFFVAESMTTEEEEFRRGVACFMRALAPGAPFFAAFMEHSEGYHAGDAFFPACDVGESEVLESLEPFAGKSGTLHVRRLRTPVKVRAGYSGMIVAYGRRNSDSDDDIPEC
ncbi:SCO2525 family SAM-dependent methyltransferase [Streptomyces sp. NBC_01451]|uniref:SCO2525 family SAM-dependent methyltransferase n=1 Tax=Streptomyces sp. NBC_01451 TaxID=2903872 RepID=UPI002E32202D|nr:SCO2525 family SAM-dependent methyltransferase [Streptomyces sp. NBC_01451]